MPRTRQEIYNELLRWCLPHLRNQLSVVRHETLFFVYARHKREILLAYEIAELVHNIPFEMEAEEANEKDLWFINVQAKLFLQSGPGKEAGIYSTVLRLVRELADRLPPSFKERIAWEIPDFPGRKDAPETDAWPVLFPLYVVSSSDFYRFANTEELQSTFEPHDLGGMAFYDARYHPVNVKAERDVGGWTYKTALDTTADPVIAALLFRHELLQFCLLRPALGLTNESTFSSPIKALLTDICMRLGLLPDDVGDTSSIS